MLLTTARRASCRGRGWVRDDDLRRPPDRIAAHGGGLPPDTASARHDRSSDHPQNDSIDPVAFAASFRVSSRQAAGPGRLPFPLPLQSCGNHRRAPAGDRCTLAQAGKTGGGHRVIACHGVAVRLRSAEQSNGRRRSEALIVALAENMGLGSWVAVRCALCHDGFPVRSGSEKPLGRSVLRFRGGLNRRPFGSRPLSRRGAAGHAVLDKAVNRASQVPKTRLTAWPPRSTWPARTLNRPGAAGSF